MGHFSGWAGAASLTVIVIPVVVRTTENMLLLVPNGLREAAAALGAPRSSVIRAVTWRAARAGIVTGVLLAIARISGETAPLLFTALNNQFWSTDLNAPMASLPAVIFQFAMSPYEDWHHLAWAGALAHHRHRADAQHHRARFSNRRSGVRPMDAGAPGRRDNVKVDIRDLCFYYGSNKALKNVTLPLYDRKVTAFIGPSGCGKSTLLRVLNRIYELYPNQRAEGEVMLDGENILQPEARHQPAAQPRRHGVPEADAVPDDDLRQHRLRHQAL